MEPTKERGLRILSLCGGGTRGVISLVYLQKIQDLVGPLHEYFDLICGTSTGAIIAYCIGFKKWNVAKINSFYDDLATKIFPHKAVQLSNTSAYSASADTGVLTEALSKYLGEDALHNYADSFPKVFAVAATSKTVPEPALLSNFPLVNGLEGRYVDVGMKIFLVEALRATTAAPTYFPPVQLGSYSMKDGGILANNPSLIALDVARTIWKERGVEILVSIGTGSTENKQGNFRKDTISPASQVIRQALRLATDSEKIHREVFNHLCDFHSTYKLKWPSHYLWLNCSIPPELSSLSINETDKLNQLKQIAEQSLLSDEIQLKLSVLTKPN